MLVTSTVAPARKSRTAVSVDDQASGGVIAPLPGIEVRGRDVPVHVQLWAIEGTAHAWWPSHFIPSLSLSDPAPLNAHTGLAGIALGTVKVCLVRRDIFCATTLFNSP